MVKRSNKNKVRRRGFCTKVMVAGALASIILTGSARTVSAQEPSYSNIVISNAGEVTLNGTSTRYTLLEDESIIRSQSGSGSFSFVEANTPNFTNEGSIGTTETPVDSLDMSTIGQFINAESGIVFFDGTLSVSAAGLQNSGTINGSDSNGTVSTGAINNTATGILTGSITGTTLTNSGNMAGLVAGNSTITATGTSITNSGTITGYVGINAEDATLQNSHGAEITDTGEINVASFTNFGTVESTSIDATTLLNQEGAEITGVQQLVSEDLTNQGTIQGNGSLDAGTSLMNSGMISGFAEITADALTNSGQIIGGNDPTNRIIEIGDGDLVNSGTIAGFAEIGVGNDFKVQNEGILRDIGQVTGKLSLIEGQVEMTGDNREMIITGDLVSNDGILTVRIDATPDSDVYTVEGKTTINGGQVKVQTTEEAGSYKLGDQWTFLTSGDGLEVAATGGLTVSEDSGTISPILKFTTSYDAENYYLNIERAKEYAPGAQSINQSQFGQYLDNVGNNYVPDSDLEVVLTALDRLSPGSGISPAGRYAMAQLDGAVYGSMTTLGVQNHNIVNNQLANYLRPDQCGCFTSCCCGSDNCTVNNGTNFWGNYYGVDGYAKSDGNAFGGDYKVSGVIVGGDRTLNSCFRLGAFFAYGGTEFDVGGLQEEVKTDSYKAGLYFVRSVDSGYFLGNINYGWDNYSATRDITFLDRHNTGETSGNQFGLRLEKGFNVSLGQSLLFQPFAAFQYIYLDTNAFQEDGVGTTALNVDASEYDSYRSEFGGRIVWCRSNDCDRHGSVFVQASWLHEYGDTYGTVTASFNNPQSQNYVGNYKYTVRGTDLGSDWCNLGLGGKYAINNFSVFGGYDFMINNSQNLHTGNVGIAYRF